jgi:hypothetical protein
MSKTKERGLVYPASAAPSLISRREYLRTTLLAASAAGLTRRTLAQTATGTSSGTPKKRIYFNPLRTDQDLHGFQLEGSALVQATAQGMRLKNSLSPTLGQESNFVLWCPEVFPDQIEIRWNFSPLAEPGLCVMFFAAQGLLQGQFVPLFDERLAKRKGEYDQYTKSDVSALQIAYFRRRYPSERAFHECVLRRAPGFQLLVRGADPIPNVEDATPPYKMRIVKRARVVEFFINDLSIFKGVDNSPHPTAGSGHIGFRQMAPLEAVYSDLEVFQLGA